MTPATKGAIQALRYIADELADSVRDDLAQMAHRMALQLEDEARDERPNEAEAKLREIKRILG